MYVYLAITLMLFMFVIVCVSTALSYNYAIDQYHPLVAKKGMMPSPFLDEKGHPKEFIWQAVNEEELQGLYCNF